MKAVVAGHLCLDIIPEFRGGEVRLEPGRLIDVGAATLACGGGVANVGQALLKLGVDATLLGKIGNDAFGDIVQAKLSVLSPQAAQSLKRTATENTSYSVVLNPPGLDRIFLHHAGCNDSFGVEDIDLEVGADADLFYFGYPPLLRRTYEDGGVALAERLREVKSLGLTTVLDMAMPDPGTASGRADWRGFLQRVLPHIDFFMPSLEEVCFMLGRDVPNDTTALAPVAEALLELGSPVVGLKMGANGLYLKTADLENYSLGRAGPRDPAAWSKRELWSPVFEADVKGTTGAGDATIAGFIAALLRKESLERCLTLANAVGGMSVEALDAVGGVGSFEDLTARLTAGWARGAHKVDSNYWHPGLQGVYCGRHDGGKLA
ncbi:sugar kinase [soil metagenome]